jgi:uncharacterized membrane protein (GlpM family)
MGFVQVLCLAISSTTKHYILEGYITIHNVFIVIEIMIKHI